MKKKILSTLLALCMVLSLLPVAAMAEDGATSVANLADLQTALNNGATVITITDSNPSDGIGAINITSGEVTLAPEHPVTITADGAIDVFDVGGGTLTLGANITVNSNTSILFAHDGGKIVVDGADINSTCSIYSVVTVGSGSTLTLNSGSITSTANSVIATEGTTNINGGTVETTAEVYCAIFAQQGGVLNVTGGNVTGANGTGVVATTGGIVNVSGGTVSSANAHFNTGVINISGDATVTGSVFNCGGAGAINISGGTVQGAVCTEDCQNAQCTKTGDKKITITGGTFSTQPSAEYIADDYMSVESDGTYTVEKTPLKRAEEQWSKFSEQANWVRVQGLAYYYGLAQTYVNGLGDGEVKNNATTRLNTLTSNINNVTTLNLADVQIPDGYNKDLGALVFFPNLTSVNVSGVNATDFGALAQLSKLETLDVSNTSAADAMIGALAGNTTLHSLNISDTAITKIQFVDLLKQLTTLTAQNLELESISGLVEIVEEETFNANGLTWDLSGSTCAAEAYENGTYFIDAIREKFADTTGVFNAPTVNPVYTVTFDANGGTCETSTATTENGKLTSLPTATRSSYTFNGWYTAASGGTKVTTDTVFPSDTTVYAQWTYNAPYYPSTGGGSSSGSSSSSGTTSTTTKNEDGSTTTTTTDKSTGTVTETTKNTDGSTTVVETTKDGTVTETVTTTDGVSGTVVTDAEGIVTEVTAEVPASADGESVTLPLEVTAATGTTDAVAIEVNVSSKVDSVTVTIPVEDVTPGTVIVLVHEDGTEEVVPKTALTEDGLSIELDGSVTVKVVDNTKTFNDTEDHWADDAITFVTSRELFNGVGNDDFAPEQTMDRAMLATVLWRLEGKQEADVNGTFSDVESGTWYTDAINWAAESGIINGYGDSYGTNDPITREQMVTILYRLNGSPAVNGSVEGASDWAADAMAWAVEIGLLQGDGNGLDPQGTATRAQVSTILMRYMGL